MLKNAKVLLIHGMLTLLFVSHVSLAQGADANSLTRLEFDKRLSTVEYPFEVKMFSFSSQGNDLEMAYMFLPPKEEKPVVTLFHGKNFNGAYWESTARLLQNQG